MILAADGHVSAYLARLLDARGLAVAASDVGPAMTALGLADSVEAVGDTLPAATAIFAIDDGSAATDARIDAALAALPGSSARLVHVVEAATLAERPVARARLRDIAVARSERGLAASSVVLHRHDSRLGPADSLPARLIAQAWQLANGGMTAPLTIADAGPCDWGWTAEYVDAIARAAALPRPRDLIVASGHAMTAREIATHACAWFRVDAGAAFDFATTSAEAEATAPEVAIAATRAATGWHATTWGRDLVRTLCEGAASRIDVA
ncbi:hypothetical protein IP88_03780 [alpha proteobacterium AAP81b]|nr:hypothetical protein IP88_03780 [alpha proteobacterium AAP81b]